MQALLIPRWYRILVTLLIALLSAGGFVALWLSQLSYTRTSRWVNQLAVDGHAELFTPALASSIQTKLIVLVVALWLLACGLFVARRAGYRLLQKVTDDFWELVSSCRSPKSSWVSTFDLCALAVLTVVSVYVRMQFLFREVYYDEAFTYLSYVSKPLVLGLSNYSEPNNHLLHTALVRGSYLLLGAEQWALRLPAFVAGILSLPALYFFSKRYDSTAVAVCSVSLFTCAAAMIEYSTLARGYSLLVLLTVILAHCSLALRDNPNNYCIHILWVFISAAGFYTIPIFLYPWLALFIWLALERYRTKQRLTHILKNSCFLALASATFTVLCYVPPLIARGPGALFSNTHVSSQGIGYFFREAPDSLLWTWESWHLALPPHIPLLMLLLAAFACFKELRQQPRRLPLLVILIAIGATLTFAQQVVPYRRIWLYLQPFYFLYVAIGLTQLLRPLLQSRIVYASFIIASLVLSGFQSQAVISEYQGTFHNDQGTLRDAQAITTWLQPKLGPGDLVLTIAPADAVLRYYFHRANLPLDYLDPESHASRRLFLVHNLEPNFTKGGAARHQSIEELLLKNDRSNLTKADIIARKQFPFSSVYLIETSANDTTMQK